MVTVAALHRAAERIWDESRTPEMDALAVAIGDFIHTSEISDDGGTPLVLEPRSFGYGVMIGFLAGLEP